MSRFLIAIPMVFAEIVTLAGPWRGLDRRIAEYYHYFPLQSAEVLRYKLKYQIKILTEVRCLFNDSPSGKQKDPDVTDTTMVLLPLDIRERKPELVKPGNGVMEPGETFDDGKIARVPIPALVRPECVLDNQSEIWLLKWTFEDETEEEVVIPVAPSVRPTPSPTPTPKASKPPANDVILDLMDQI